MKYLLICCLFFFSSQAFGQKALSIYGGENSNVYLGCINCSNLDPNSIWNELGDYGSNLSANSIWNDLGTYGGDMGDFSPFNSMANYPPKIVDNDGSFYGYLTTNTMQSSRAEFKLAKMICENWKSIKNNVGGWYKKIFN